MPPRSQHPVALVTGAAGQIGARLVERFTEAGYAVAGLDLADGDGILGCDITDPAAVRATIDRVLAEHGRIDVLVHNAGVSAIGRFEDHDVETHARVLAVNHLGPVALTQAALPALRETRGRVVVIGSVAGFAPVLGRPAYVGAKHAVTGLFEALRPELAVDGVGVTLVHPTFVAAPMAGTEGRATTGSQVTADDVARTVLEAVAHGRDRVLVGRTARLAWHVHRLAPNLYAKLMTRRLED